MSKLESDKVLLQKPASEVYAYVSNLNNFGKLMPSQVVNYTSTENECTFTIQGMATLNLRFEGNALDKAIHLVPVGKAPFDFILSCLLNDSAQGCEAQMVMDADLNPFMKMMAEKPLTNFLNLLASKLKAL